MRAEEHLVLVQKLLDDFGKDPDSEVALLHLHALFGPTLISALQLVDDRDVVRVRMPGGRTIYQVSSSTGVPYTLYLSVPSRIQAKSATASSEAFAFGDPGPADIATISRSPSPSEETAVFMRNTSSLAHMFCPCPGFAYQSLLTDKAVMCKHLLAVLLAFYAGKFVESEVGMPGVVGLLNLTPA